MTERGVVFDLGYTPHEGERRGRRGAITTTYRDGLYRVFGIHRRARKKIFPWLLVVFAILPAVVFVGFAFLLSTFAPGADSPFGGHAEYFGITASVILLFVALAAPELLIPDRREGVLAVYSSRPLRPDDYVGARASSLLTVIAGFMLIPRRSCTSALLPCHRMVSSRHSDRMLTRFRRSSALQPCTRLRSLRSAS